MARGTITQKQIRFVEEYVSLGNASEAYRRAFAPGESSIGCAQRAWELLKSREITDMVDAKRKESADRTSLTLDRMMGYHREIIEFDPSEITHVRTGACRHCYGDDHLYQWREPEYLEALKIAQRDNAPMPDYAGGFGYNRTLEPVDDCPNCDGLGIEYDWIADTRTLSDGARKGFYGVKRTKDGLQILMPDKQKALDALARLAGFDSTNVRVSSDLGALAAALSADAIDPGLAAQAYQKLMEGAFKLA